ncbi:hypothetical protein [Cellulomonas sp. KRMCY2]|uniref:hypothetical protein n=1 Tax=Cellulomonas sp. KRMCY2 TaxID=1304865 RepID=UPI0004BB9C7D|nr:hypothetical protein [Cellulomonas sp. KRMCY2]
MTYRTAEQQRRRRRRAWLLWGTSPAWLTAVVLGVILSVKVGLNASGIASFEDGDHAAAARTFEAVGVANLVERWKAPFNTGTARYQQGDLWDALDELDHALELVPDPSRCMVQINRALVLEAWGDDEMEQATGIAAEADQLEADIAQDPGVALLAPRTPQELREESQEYAAWAESDYTAAQAARADETCQDEDQMPPEQQQQNEESQDRLGDKADQAEQASQPEQTEEPADGDQTPREQEEQRQEELAQRNAEAEADAEAQRQEENGQGGGSGTRDW